MNDFKGSMWHNEFPNPKPRKIIDTQPIAEMFEGTMEQLENLLPKKEPVEYLSKIQNDLEYIGERAKAVRIQNGIELKDIANRVDAERIERGQFIDSLGQPITVRHLIQYAHEIGGKLSLFNLTPEE